MSPPDLKPPPEASVVTLVSGIIHDAQELFKQQLELFKHEIKDDLRKAIQAVAAFAIAAVLGAVGTLLAAFMLVHLLNWGLPGLPLWICYLIIGAIFLVASGALCFLAMLKLKALHPPGESVQALRENVQWLTNRK
jgi:hypothetical protein